MTSAAVKRTARSDGQRINNKETALCTSKYDLNFPSGERHENKIDVGEGFI